MPVTEIILAVLLGLLSLGLIVAVLMQPGKDKRLSGAIAGGADTFFSKGKAKTLDAKLAKMTKWVALGFVVLTLVLNLLYSVKSRRTVWYGVFYYGESKWL